MKKESSIARILFISYVIMNIVVVVLSVSLIIPLLPILVVLLFRRLTRKERFISSLKTSAIGKLTAGPSKVEGKIYAKESIISPYFKESCVGYLYTQEERSTNSDNEEYYTQIYSDSKCDYFYVADETGQILVESPDMSLEFCNARSLQQGDILHAERLLKNQQHIILSGTTVFENNEWKFSSPKPLFAATQDKISSFKERIFDLEGMKWYYIALYVFINYLVFFLKVTPEEQSGLFGFLSFFGLPIAGLFFMLLKRWHAVFGTLASICLIACMLSFPLMMVLYLQAFPPQIIRYALYAIVITVALTTVLGSRGKTIEHNSTVQ